MALFLLFQVSLILIEKEDQITLLKEELSSKEKLIEKSQQNVLKSCDKLEKSKSKIDKVLKLNDQHQDCQEQLTSLRKNGKQLKTEMTKLEELVKVTEAEKDKIYKKLMDKEKLLKSQKKGEDKDLISDLKLAVAEKDDLQKEILDMENELEITKKESQR